MQRSNNAWVMRCGLTLLAFLSPCHLVTLSPCQAKDAGPRTPYRLELVVVLGKHPDLSDLFRERLETELRGTLQTSLGELAQVDVRHGHPRLREVESQGLDVLDQWTERTPVKTHFVIVDIVDGQYEVRTRQYDGNYAFASPLIRTRRTRDRDGVARTAALLVEHDFGLIGTATATVDWRSVGGRVRLDLQGGGLGVPLDQRVRVGEVFAVLQTAPGKPGRTTPWALLRVEEAPRNGSCVCRYYTRHPNPLRAGTLCVKFGTREQAALNLDVTLHTSKELSAELRKLGFDRKEEPALLTTELKKQKGIAHLRSDALRSDLRFDHVAFVSIVYKDRVRAILPVALLDDHDDRPAVTELADAAVETDEGLYGNTLLWKRDVDGCYFKLQLLYRRLNVLADKEETRAEALRLAREGADGCRADHARLTKELADLKTEAGKGSDTIPPDLLAAGQRRLRDVQVAETDLRTFADGLEAVQKEEAKRREIKTEVLRGLALEKELEIGQAIAIYDKVLKQDPNNAELRRRKEKLEEKWKTTDRERLAVRRFVYEEWYHKKWPLEEMKAKLEEARKAFEICKKANEWFTIKKLADGTDKQADHLQEILAGISRGQVNPGDNEKTQLVQEINKGLGDLARDADRYLKDAEPAQGP
jgi:hypothetical protein